MSKEKFILGAIVLSLPGKANLLIPLKGNQKDKGIISENKILARSFYAYIHVIHIIFI